MKRSFICVIILLILAAGVAGCASKKKAYNERRGLMLLETSQLGRNKGYYAKHKAKKLDRHYKKIVKNRKYTYKGVNISPDI